MGLRITFFASVAVLVGGASAVSLADSEGVDKSASVFDPYAEYEQRDLALLGLPAPAASSPRDYKKHDYQKLAQVSGSPYPYVGPSPSSTDPSLSGGPLARPMPAQVQRDLSGGPLAKPLPPGTAPSGSAASSVGGTYPSTSGGYGSYSYQTPPSVSATPVPYNDPSTSGLAGGHYQGGQYQADQYQAGQYQADQYQGGQYQSNSVYDNQGYQPQPAQAQTYSNEAYTNQSYQNQTYQNQGYQGQNSGPNAPRPTQKRSWWQKLGLDNLATRVDGYLRGGFGGVERDFGDDDSGSEGVLDAMVRGEVSAITQGGLEYGVSLKLRGQRDNYRRGFGGSTAVFGTGDCPPSSPGCASATIGANTFAVRGHTGQLFNFGDTDLSEDEFALEGAHLFLRSAYGDVTLGRDDGAAALFSLEGPSTLPLARAANSRVDYTGLDITKTVNDASGFAEKITYVSPRLLGDNIGFGVQFGASYAPSTDVCGVDYCVRSNDLTDVTSVLSPDLEDAIEFGVAFDRTFNNGLRAELALNYAGASESSGIAVFDDLTSYGAGLSLSYNAFDFGASYLSSNNGWDGDGDYDAYEASLTWQPNKWGVTASYGAATDDLAQSDGSSALLGVSYDFNDRYTIGAGLQYTDRDVPVFNGTNVVITEQDAAGLFIEGGIRF